MFAIDGQPADLANTVRKYSAKKAMLLDKVPNMNVVIAASPTAQIKTLLPPSLSANTPVVSLPVKLPAVPQPRIAPKVAISRLRLGSANIEGPATPTTVLQSISMP
jgi:hypothetical protein